MKNSLAALLGEQIRTRRKELKWTQEELAARLGLEVNTVSRMECGARTPSLDRLGQIAEVLQVSAASLLGVATPSSHDQADVLVELLEALTPDERAVIVATARLQADYFRSKRRPQS